MLTYRLINNRLKHLCQIVWDAEQESPAWFRTSGQVWHPTFATFEAFWNDTEKYGLFDDERLLAVVYIEDIGPGMLNVHCSVLDPKTAERHLIAFFQSLVRKKAVYEGATTIVGWLLDKNRGLRRVIEKAGFYPTGLTMRYGQYRGRVLKWVQVRY
jgi:RimJ/RimL family protein N-acetyltransferase